MIEKSLTKTILIVLLLATLFPHVGCSYLTNTNTDGINVKNTIDLSKSDAKFRIVGSIEFGIFDKVPIVTDRFNNVCFIDDEKITRSSKISLLKILEVDGVLLDIFNPATFYQQNKSVFHFIIWTITRKLEKNYLSKYYLSFSSFHEFSIKKDFSIETPASKIALYTEFHDAKGIFDSVLLCQSVDDRRLYQYDRKNVLCNSYVYEPSKVVCYKKLNLPVVVVCSGKSMMFTKPLSRSQAKFELDKTIALDSDDTPNKQVINDRNTDPIIISNLYNICFYNGTYTYIYNIDRGCLQRLSDELLMASKSGYIIATSKGIYSVEKGYYKNSISIKTLFEASSSRGNYSVLQLYNDYVTDNMILKAGESDGQNFQLRILVMSPDGSQKRLFKMSEPLKGRILFSYYNLIIADDCIYILEDLSFLNQVNL